MSADPIMELLRDLRDAGVRLTLEDGGALRFKAPPGAFSAELKARLKVNKAAVVALLKGDGSGDGKDALPQVEPDPANRHAPFPLTEIQHAYWVGRSPDLELGNVATHAYLEINAESLDLDVLETAWNRLVAHHDMLRVIIAPDGTQRILENVPPYRIVTEDLTDLSESERTKRLAKRAGAMAEQTLSCEDWPLFEIRASLLPGGAVRLHVSLDFLMADTTSLSLIFDQWNRLYQDPATHLPQSAITFRDYVLAERRLRETDAFGRARHYWMARLSNLPPAPRLPLAQNPAGIERPRFVGRTGYLPKPGWERIKETARKRGLTPSAVLLAAFSEVLATWSTEPAFTLNLTLFQRLPLHPDVDRIVGDFTSLVPLEVNTAHSQTFAERAKAVQSRLWSDLDHRAMGGVEIMREWSRLLGDVPGALLPVVFTSALNIGEPNQDAQPFFGTPGETRSQTPQVWIDHQASERDGALKTTWDAVEALFPAGLLDGMFAAYGSLLERLAADPLAWDTPVPCLTPETDRAVTNAANATLGPLPDETLPGLIRAQAARTPDAPAIIAPNRTLSYAALVTEAEALAAALIERGLAPGDRVAIHLERGWAQALACLGVLMARGVYLPLDPALPQARRDHLLARTGTALVLSTKPTQDKTWPDGVTALDTEALAKGGAPETPLPAPEPDTPAYIIFTSGSTGEPKGVVITHRAAINTIIDVNARFGMDSQSRILGLSALSFDLSVYDLFGPWAAGGALVTVAPESAREPASWAAMLGERDVTHWNSVPALMELMVDHLESSRTAAPGDLRVVLLSGDWIPTSLPDRVRALWPQAKVISLGGATEGAIWSIFHPIDRVDPDWSSIPYGLPLTNQTMHVLDPHGRPRPLHVPGEIHIGGAGLALGYWDDPERTAAAFVTDPETGMRLYRTGDLGRRHPDGSLEFLGRTDNQMKINGHRIEPGEIEAVLEAHPGISRAVVSAVGAAKGAKRLAAHLALAEAAPGAPVVEHSISPEVVQIPWQAALKAGQEAAAGLPAADLALIAEARSAMEAEATRAMVRTLRSLGLFAKAGERRTAAGIVTALALVERHTKLLEQWMAVLAEDGLLSREGDGYVAPAPLPDPGPTQNVAPADGPLAETLSRWPAMAPAWRYFSHAMAAQEDLLKGTADPLDVLFPEGDDDRAQALYQFNPLATFQGQTAGVIVEGYLAAQNPADKRTLRILEVGAGTGASTADILPHLPRERISYTFTDLSPYFLERARERFADIGPSLETGLLDITRDPRHQGYEAHGFDVVIASNVLHDAPHVDRALGHIRRLLAPGGLALVLESTRNTRSQMATVAFLEGFAAYDDERLNTNLPLLSAPAWVAAMERTGFTVSQALPDPDAPEAVLDMHVIAGQAPLAVRDFAPEIIREHLATRLPAHMIPAVLLAWESLPLTTNDKVDRKALTAAILSMAGDAHGDGAPMGTPPETPLEEEILTHWRSVLGKPLTAVNRSFFEVGGDSLLATMLVSRLNTGLGLSLTLRALFEAPTVRDQARLVESLQWAATNAVSNDAGGREEMDF